MPDRVVGSRLLVDRVTRPAYIDQAGKQYVLDGDGRRVEGVWVLPPEAPAPDNGEARR